MNLDIVYEDEHILLINKPVGMLSQKAETKDESLVEHIISYMLNTGQLTETDLRSFKPSICNRLDRNTSGLVVAGKSLLGLQTMGELIKSRSIKKYYRCLVLGEIKKREYIKGYLTKDEITNKVCILAKKEEGAMQIETAYEPIWSNGKITLLEVHLITGRTHQIRAHLSSISHPIIGDYKYGDRNINDEYKEKYGLTSQLLHAFRLELPELEEPFSYVSNKQFVAPIPTLFETILQSENYEG